MEDIIIAGIIPILIFNLLNKTPLKVNSSIIGAQNTDAIVKYMKSDELKRGVSKSKSGIKLGSINPWIQSALDIKYAMSDANKKY